MMFCKILLVFYLAYMSNMHDINLLPILHDCALDGLLMRCSCEVLKEMVTSMSVMGNLEV